ncbi:DUF2478 domain-containing protein [Blastochloris sulfoviridis]|uniref:DUF2478 domain-containing protein n=1 Tax=Blastochloris sulfoviridis TaxID=50712 RepID=A0A5M6I0V8_9HYPH|nr:DUF2478 domain-containing protein [Blastochloris sulfoviridis]KAA5601824.1 DUF2478 domain-containing protein [Blastochloris sulfoviridis]
MPSDRSLPAPIAAVRGEDRMAADALRAFALARKADGVRVGGIVVAAAGDLPPASRAGSTSKGILLDVSTGEVISIRQELGPGSQACNLDTAALARACAAVERAIAGGVDLVVLNKFGGQEVARRGMMSAFHAAAAAGLPIACVVSPKAADVWQAFAAELAVWVPPDLAALEAWWDGVAASRRTAA